MELSRSSRFLWLVFGCWAVVYIWTVWPTLSQAFAYNDDYLYFQYDSRRWPFYHPQFSFFLLSGRMLYNVFSWLMSQVLWRMADFTCVRAAACLLSLGLGGLVYRDLLRARWPAAVAGALVFLILGLPGALMHLIWVTMVPFYFSMFGAYLAAQFALDEAPGRGRWFLSVVLLLISLFIYQPGAMFFLLATALVTLRWCDDWSLLTSKILRAGKVFCTGSLVYFGMQKAIVLPLLFRLRPALRDEYLGMGPFRFALNSNFVGRVLATWPEVSRKILGFWWLEGLGQWTLILVLFLTTLLMWEAFRSRSGFRLWMSGCLVSALLSIGPSLISAGHFGFRVVLVASSLMLVLIVAVLRRLMPARLLTVLLAGLSLLVAIHDRRLLEHTVKNAVYEFSALKENLKSLDFPAAVPLQIYSIAPAEQISYLGDQTQGEGEFYYNSASFWAIHAWMIRAALIESGYSRADLSVENELAESRPASPGEARYKVRVISKGTDIQHAPATAHVIDFNSFYLKK